METKYFLIMCQKIQNMEIEIKFPVHLNNIRMWYKMKKVCQNFTSTDSHTFTPASIPVVDTLKSR